VVVERKKTRRGGGVFFFFFFFLLRLGEWSEEQENALINDEHDQVDPIYFFPLIEVDFNSICQRNSFIPLPRVNKNIENYFCSNSMKPISNAAVSIFIFHV